ncbi:hypothetical protein Tco_1291334 [Tanacetum coccineum]
MKTISTPLESNKALIKDEEADSMDVHLYRLMIGSLMYLTASRPDIMFDVYACARDSPFDLEAFSNSEYARASLDRKSTTGAEYVAAANCCRQVIKIHTDHNVTDLLRKAFDVSRFNFLVANIGGDSVERAITTDASLVAAQDIDNIIRTQTTAMPNVDIPQGMNTSGSPRRQETMGGALAQTRSERVLGKPNKPPLPEGYTSGSEEGSMEHYRSQ